MIPFKSFPITQPETNLFVQQPVIGSLLGARSCARHLGLRQQGHRPSTQEAHGPLGKVVRAVGGVFPRDSETEEALSGGRGFNA